MNELLKGILDNLVPILSGMAVASIWGAALLEVVKQLKELLAAVEDAGDPEGPGGKNITKEEMAQIAAEAKDVKVSVGKLWQALKRIFKKD